MADNQPTEGLTFWDHLDELRRVLMRIGVVVVGLMLVAFLFKDELFAVILAPKEMTDVRLINTELAAQFITHMRVSFFAGFLLASPYIIYQLFRFVSPALYAHERRYSTRAVGWSYVLFLAGVLLNYYVIFPFTFRFLATYQVSVQVENTITLTSYMDTLMTMSLLMGIVFEIPILSWLFAKLGFITKNFMKRYRRHALMIMLVTGAIITPTSDVFTLMLVSLPMYLLYEVSIYIVARTQRYV